MTNELAKKEDTVAAIPELTPLTLIAQAIENPDFDVAKLEKMMDLQERWEDRQAEKAFSKAMSEFQAQSDVIPRSKSGGHGKYAPLDAIMRQIQPTLAANGLSVSFSTDFPNEGFIRAFCTVSHADGHSFTSEMAVPIDEKMSANSTQKMGSANAYAKRYALGNALNLSFADEDDDADIVSENSFASKQAKTKVRGQLRKAAYDSEHAVTRQIWDGLDADQIAELWQSYGKADRTLIEESLAETK